MTRQFNPAVLAEAEHMDGPLTERDLVDLAYRKNLPLYVDATKPVVVEFPRLSLNATELATLQRQHREAFLRAAAAWREVDKIEQRIAQKLADGEL